MRMKLESVKSLDANVEKHGAREIKYNDNLNKEDMEDSYSYLFDMLEIDERTMLEIEAAAFITEMELGKHTIGVSTQEKEAVKYQDRNMEPISEELLEKISGEMDKEEYEILKEKYKKIAMELEGMF